MSSRAVKLQGHLVEEELHCPGKEGEQPHPRTALRYKARGQRDGATSGRKLGGARQDQQEAGGAGWSHSLSGHSTPHPIPAEPKPSHPLTPDSVQWRKPASGEHLLGRGTVCVCGREGVQHWTAEGKK